MGLLERLRGEPSFDVCKFDRDHYDVTYTVSTDTHEIAYAIAVSDEEREALTDLVRAEEAAAERAERAVETAFDDGQNAEAVVGRLARPRRVARSISERWADLARDDPDVVYLPIGTAPDLAAFVATCRERAGTDDEFVLPDSFWTVTELVVRIREATEDPTNRVVVHRDRLPTPVEGPPSAESSDHNTADSPESEASS